MKAVAKPHLAYASRGIQGYTTPKSMGVLRSVAWFEKRLKFLSVLGDLENRAPPTES